jgi:RNA-directed DNA polymerase
MPVEGRNLSSELTLKVAKDRRLGNLATPISVQKLRTALHAKAKESPGFRFYALYDKIYRMDVLRHAYACCRANKGAAGVDDLTFDDIEAYGREQWLGELAQQLRRRGNGDQSESQTWRMGQLFLSWSGYVRLPVH